MTAKEALRKYRDQYIFTSQMDLANFIWQESRKQALDEAIKIIESVKLPEAGYDRERWHNAALDRAIEALK